MIQYKFNLYTHLDFSERAKIFKEKYDLVKFVSVSDELYSKRNLKGYSSRTCRFCGRSYPDTAFSNLSHLLPQLIGNPDLYSDFECDECNAFFSRLENDLAAYLGISRSIVGLNGTKKTPGFTAKRMKAKSRSFIGNNILILAPEDITIEGAAITLSYTKNPYTPSNVYKALLKSALSLLDEIDIKENYSNAIRYLNGEIEMTIGAVIGGYRLAFNNNIPLHAFCFRKKHVAEQIPKDVICFNFQSHFIFFPIPVDKSPDPLGLDEYQIILPPPHFLREQMVERALPVPFIHDLTTKAEISDEEETITFQIDPEYLENMWSYDPATDIYQQEQPNLSELKHIILSRSGVTVDPKELSTFLRKEMEGKG